MNKVNLKELLEDDRIEIPDIQSIISMKKEKELLACFKYKYWQGNNGNWYVHVPDKKKGRILKKRNTKKEIEQVIIDYQMSVVNNPTIEEVFNDWNDYRRDLKKISKSSHTRLAQVFKRHFEEFGKLHIKDVSKEDYVEFLERQIPEYDLSSKAFASLKSVTRGILKRAKRKGYIDFYPEEVFSDFEKIGNIQYNDTYNAFINQHLITLDVENVYELIYES